MPIPRTIRAAAIALGLLGSSYPALTNAADLKIVIDGLRSNRGAVRVALFSDASGFKTDTRLAGAFITAKPGRVAVAFPELAPGTYAVSAFHDENGNGDLDTNFLGVPNEGYGFSNQAKGAFGPPSFEAASLAVEDQPLTVTLKLNY